jgi:hypothetical protein
VGEKKIVYTERMPVGLDKIVTNTHIIFRAKNISETELPLCIHEEPIDDGTKYACVKSKLKHCSNL